MHTGLEVKLGRIRRAGRIHAQAGLSRAALVELAERMPQERQAQPLASPLTPDPQPTHMTPPLHHAGGADACYYLPVFGNKQQAGVGPLSEGQPTSEGVGGAAPHI